MFTIKKTNILEKDLEAFLLDPHTITVVEESTPTMSTDEVAAMLHEVSDNAIWSIDSILKDTIRNIKDVDLRNWFRRFLIAQKHGILPRYPSGGTGQYAIVYASDDCVLTISPHLGMNQENIQPLSTIVLSPEGEIMIPEGEVWVNEHSLTSHGFTAKRDGKFGIITKKGSILFPCIFENLENSDLAEYGCARYKGFVYSYRLRGTFPEVDPETIKNDKTIGFCCEDNVYSVTPLGEDYNIENMDELREILYSLQ